MIVRLGRCLGREAGTLKTMAWWSETARSRHCRLVRGKPVEHTRSSVWPLLWVGPCTCCTKLKQSSSDKQSASRRLDGDVADRGEELRQFRQKNSRSLGRAVYKYTLELRTPSQSENNTLKCGGSRYSDLLNRDVCTMDHSQPPTTPFRAGLL